MMCRCLQHDLGLLLSNLSVNGISNLEIKKFDNETGMRVASVDSFQGHEKHIMIMHFVLAKKGSADPFGFVKSPYRLNVSTRAQEFQFFVSNMTLWREWKDSNYTPDSSTRHIKEVIDYMDRRDHFFRSV